MAWTIRYLKSTQKQFRKIDFKARDAIRVYLEERVLSLDNPRSVGKSLQGALGVYWRYRIGNYRVICDIQDKELVVLVIEVGHRKKIYKK